jgi:hypothetical protein
MHYFSDVWSRGGRLCHYTDRHPGWVAHGASNGDIANARAMVETLVDPIASEAIKAHARKLHAEQANAGWVNVARQLPACAKYDRGHGALSDQRVCGINWIGAADNAHLLY